MIENLIRKNRSCRRFDQSRKIDLETLRHLVNLARLSASAANLQPLKFIVCSDPKINARVFPFIGWAAYLADWKGPEEGERPSAYIIMLGDTAISPQFSLDPGIAAQSILLGAREADLAGCMIGAFNEKGVRKVFEIEEHLQILLVLALGKPAEEACIESISRDGDIRYWRDERGVHHVPKRNLEDIIVASYGDHEQS
jgi:nitroreductase